MPFYSAFWYNICTFVMKITIIMKTKLFSIFAILVALISFNSCDLKGDANYTPEIIFVQLPFNQHGDTLKAFITDTGIKLDTITVGDTVSFYLYLAGYENNLKTFYLKQSADSSTRVLYTSKNSMDSIFTTSTSNYSNGQFYLNANTTGLYFPFKYIARKPSNEASLTFSVVSDAKFDKSPGSNTSTLILKTPIRKPLAPKGE